MAKLQDLPDELLLRILTELDGHDSPNPLHGLAVSSRRLHNLFIPFLYHSITLNTFRQLELLVSRVSGAWKLPPEHCIKHVRINAEYVDEDSIFMTAAQTRGLWSHNIIRCLSELVKSSSAGYLESLCIHIGPLRGTVRAQTHPPHLFFKPFLGIQAKRLECTVTHTLPDYYRLGQRSFWSNSDELAGLLARNAYLEHLRIPFLHPARELHKFIDLLKRRRCKTLHINWPLRLELAHIVEMLWELQDTLEEKGLVIAAPPSYVHRPETPQSLYRQFRHWNPNLDPANMLNDLRSLGFDEDETTPVSLMSRLDWRIEELDIEAEQANANADQQQEQPAVIAPDGMVTQGSAAVTRGWMSSLTGLVSRMWYNSSE